MELQAGIIEEDMYSYKIDLLALDHNLIREQKAVTTKPSRHHLPATQSSEALMCD